MTPVQRINKARTTNAHRDKLDHSAGFAAPSDTSSDQLLRTVMCAIWAGLELEDWDHVAEAYEMARELHQKMRGGADYDPARWGA